MSDGEDTTRRCIYVGGPKHGEATVIPPAAGDGITFYVQGPTDPDTDTWTSHAYVVRRVYRDGQADGDNWVWAQWMLVWEADDKRGGEWRAARMIDAVVLVWFRGGESFPLSPLRVWGAR